MRPPGTRQRGLLAVLALLVGLALAPAATGAHQDSATLAQELADEVNRVRAELGLRTLVRRPQLDRAAAQHAEAMARLGYFSHESPDGSSHKKRITSFYRVGRPGTWGVGEVQLWAAYSMNAAEAVAYWLEGSPHRSQVLDRRWRDLGVAIVEAPGAPGIFRGMDVMIAVIDFGWRS